LVVDPDRVLPLPVTLERFEPVAGGRPQVPEIGGGVEIAQLPTRNADQICRKTFWVLAVEDGLRGPIPKASDHRRIVSFDDTDIKNLAMLM